MPMNKTANLCLENETKMNYLFLFIVVFGCLAIWFLSDYKLKNRNDGEKKERKMIQKN